MEKKFRERPDHIRPRVNALRSLILSTAAEIEGLDELEETLKWGEPSYLAKHGHTIRMDWKAKQPGQYAIYFKCTSKLVPTFREVYGDLFTYEKNRAIVFGLRERVPERALKECIGLALQYHRLKDKPRLGK